ncbi:MAG: bifunctional acetaldehyde-CoA/alcohol dehydrogenase [Sporolactobacillus sp.]|jgi:acetaldehyde dehydrogenase/alcohol dehydrogenase|nr:bifunctional acetaldehyde-CoA/alcohol dehydrogenase [Sporolactobacillus sp.]
MAVREKNIDPEQSVKSVIGRLVDNALGAAETFRPFTQQQIDEIVRQMAVAGLSQHKQLAKLAVEETHRGVYEDKIIKNIFATEYIYHHIKRDRTVGVISGNPYDETIKIAEPIGVIAGITPVTNPTSTVMFKSIIAMKTKNPIIFAFHPFAQKSSAAAAKIVREAAIKAGAPENCIQWIKQPSLEATQTLMGYPGVSLILATGGPGMVKAAYSSGKPALGVGPGNVPCYIEKSADIKQAVNDLIMSKTFDNGMICASESAVIIDQDIFAAVKKEMTDNGCYFLTPQEKQRVQKVVINEEKITVNPKIVGQPAASIAQMAGLNVPADTKVLVAPLQSVGPEDPLSREKLSPVLACYQVRSTEEGFKRCEEMLAFGGSGHSAAIHTSNHEIAVAFGKRMHAGRIIVNAPSSQGGIGDLYNAFIPSLTLGCGSYGGNSVSHNVGVADLINIKTIGNRRSEMQWFKLPPKIFFEKNATRYLSQMPDISRAMIVTGPDLVDSGKTDDILYALSNRPHPVRSEIFADFTAASPAEAIAKGTAFMNKFKPDVIISLGGRREIGAAKGMWLLYENPDVDLSGMRQAFLNIRKRVYKFPALGKKAKFVAMPTHGSDGLEVTPFATVADPGGNVFPLTDYALTPDVAILDPDYALSASGREVADDGFKILTEATEAYVSVMAGDFSDGPAVKTIQLVFQYLRAACDGKPQALEKMQHASALAGMAYANAFLGVNHSLAYELSNTFHLPMARCCAAMLPHVVRYNSQKPAKFAEYPQYRYFIADRRYAELAKAVDTAGETTTDGVNHYIRAIEKLAADVGEPMNLKSCGIPKEAFDRVVDELADRAQGDQYTLTNPKYPLVAELADLYRRAYE